MSKSTLGWVAIAALILGAILMIAAPRTPLGEVLAGAGFVVMAFWYRKDHASPITQVRGRLSKGQKTSHKEV
jgi:hypothetical protein